MAGVSHRGIVIAALAGCLLVAAGVVGIFGPPLFSPKRPLVTLTRAEYAEFQARFNAASDSTRILVLLSPT